MGRDIYGLISKSYSNSNVTGYNYAGGLIGSKVSGACTSSYWNTQTSCLTKSSGGTGKTTAAMKLKSTYSKWNFTTAWLYKTSSYPTLR